MHFLNGSSLIQLEEIVAININCISLQFSHQAAVWPLVFEQIDEGTTSFVANQDASLLGAIDDFEHLGGGPKVDPIVRMFGAQ